MNYKIIKKRLKKDLSYFYKIPEKYLTQEICDIVFYQDHIFFADIPHKYHTDEMVGLLAFTEPDFLIYSGIINENVIYSACVKNITNIKFFNEKHITKDLAMKLILNYEGTDHTLLIQVMAEYMYLFDKDFDVFLFTEAEDKKNSFGIDYLNNMFETKQKINNSIKNFIMNI